MPLLKKEEVSRHWCQIVKLIDEYSKELDFPDRIVYVVDQKVITVVTCEQLIY